MRGIATRFSCPIHKAGFSNSHIVDYVNSVPTITLTFPNDDPLSLPFYRSLVFFSRCSYFSAVWYDKPVSYLLLSCSTVVLHLITYSICRLGNISFIYRRKNRSSVLIFRAENYTSASYENNRSPPQ